MAAERITPDGLPTLVNLSGAVTDIDDDPDSADAAWLTAPGANNNTEARCTFAAPSGNLSTGAGLQEFRCLVRKTNHPTNPTCDIELWEGAALVATLVSGQSVGSTSGVVLSATWDAASLAGADGSGVECRVVGTTGGGNPGNRASLEVGAIEWNAEVAGVTPQSISASGAGSATLAPTAVMARTLAGTATAAANVASSVTLGRLLAGAVAATAGLHKSVAKGIGAAATGAATVLRGTAKGAQAAASAAAALAGAILVPQALTAPATAAAQLASAFTAGPGPAIPFLRRLLRAVLRRVVRG